MKKTVLVFGVISGVIATVLMFATVPFHNNIGFGNAGLLVGYAGITLSLLLVFFGIRSYRENIGNGYITFGRAFGVGILISLIMCLFYILSWEVVYHLFMPDIMDKMAAHQESVMRAKGATPEAINTMLKEMKDFKVMYANPLIRAMFTFIEPFPVALIVTLVSSLILRKRKPAESSAPYGATA